MPDGRKRNSVRFSIIDGGESQVRRFAEALNVWNKQWHDLIGRRCSAPTTAFQLRAKFPTPPSISSSLPTM